MACGWVPDGASDELEDALLEDIDNPLEPLEYPDDPSLHRPNEE